MLMKVIASAALSLAIAQDIGLALTVQYPPPVRAIDGKSLVNKPQICPAVFNREILGWGAGTSITRGSAWGNEFVRAVRGRVEYATDPFTSYQATAGQCTSAGDVVRYLTQVHAGDHREDSLYIVDPSIEGGRCPVPTLGSRFGPTGAGPSVELVQCVQGCHFTARLVTTCWSVKHPDDFGTEEAQASRCTIVGEPPNACDTGALQVQPNL
ncbi:hypothetical protein BKA62DRAFT_773617 [Auriculariales sp. MPI-PUGE-AT-0066]|nr:hypothetical protein BKA62DRAFT_773617 [Auriculariales sp. MPI-PUGE-AT-0066]